MIAGFGGGLMSHAYVEQRLLPGVDRDRVLAFERRLLNWWRGVSRTMGPASSARAVHDLATVPLLDLLEHERGTGVPGMLGIISDLPVAHAVVLSLPWTSTPASAWRDAIRLGLDANASWALVCNGRALRVIDCRRAWSRAAIEFEFDRLSTSAQGAAALWMLACPAALETLRDRVAASDAHAVGVCTAVGNGVLAALPSLADALRAGRRATADSRTAFDQSLTLVYRVLFLLFAEARGLVPVWNDIYRNAYSIAALVDRVSGPGESDGRRAGLWEALQAISRLAHAGCVAGDLRVTAFNGRLFSPRHAPLVAQRRLPDRLVRTVLLALATETTREGARRICYHDLGVEQLGSVYERVLEHEPRHRGATLILERTSTQRKTTGSFYTPQSLTEFLVRRTLAPLVANRTARDILALRVVDPAMGSGAFLVAACRFLADSCEQALIRDNQWPADADAAERTRLRRLVAEQCLYGVDRNPAAVQLARLSLWLTTLAGDRPLTFLDHHLAVGNSLVGAWLDALSQPPSSKAAKPLAPLPLFANGLAHDVSVRILPARLRMALEPSDSLEAVRNKEHTLAALGRDAALGQWRTAADAWCGSALWPGPPPPAGLVREWLAAATGEAVSLPAASLQGSLTGALQASAAHGAFHWQLAFPEIFFNDDGTASSRAGFDAVIGNPPWEMLRADTGTAHQRGDARPAAAAAMRFFRTSRVYRLQGTGHSNSYQLFLERSLQLTRPDGRVGLLLPSGIGADHGSATLRRHLFDRTSIDTWIGFENRRRIFPVHRSVRFVLLTATNAGSTTTLRFRSGVTDPAVLYDDNAERQLLTLSRSRIHRWSPEHLTVPDLPDHTALGIVTAIADRIPVLADPNGWHVRFGRELNATDDRPHFVALTRRLLPIVEGKQLSPFQLDLSRSPFGISRAAASRLLDATSTFARNRIAYRDVASATNKLTLIAAMLPAGVVSTHTVFCLKSTLDDRSQWCLLGLMNSLVANYLVRLQVTTHVTTALMSRLPVPRPARRHIGRLATLARSLAESGIDQDVDAYARLNALAARLYGLSPNEFEHVLATFPLLPQSQRDHCMAEFLNRQLTTELPT